MIGVKVDQVLTVPADATSRHAHDVRDMPPRSFEVSSMSRVRQEKLTALNAT